MSRMLLDLFEAFVFLLLGWNLYEYHLNYLFLEFSNASEITHDFTVQSAEAASAW